MLYTPAGYDQSATQTWPLILFLHGAGQRGDDLHQLTETALPEIIAQQDTFGFLQAYSNPELYQWLLEQKLDQP